MTIPDSLAAFLALTDGNAAFLAALVYLALGALYHWLDTTGLALSSGAKTAIAWVTPVALALGAYALAIALAYQANTPDNLYRVLVTGLLAAGGAGLAHNATERLAAHGSGIVLNALTVAQVGGLRFGDHTDVRAPLAGVDIGTITTAPHPSGDPTADPVDLTKSPDTLAEARLQNAARAQQED